MHTMYIYQEKLKLMQRVTVMEKLEEACLNGAEKHEDERDGTSQ